MSYLTALWRRISRRAAAKKLPAPTAAAAADDDDLPAGCGWFESSHDLRQGLRVVETGEDLAWAA
ncbi:MAG: hypothetical protein KGN16_16645 [Burkholderiales bacterium]|nr:hypothetical protein [Burkholderiales bacterium]